MKEKINITITDLDNIQETLRSLELLFHKLVMYYTEHSFKNLGILIYSFTIYFNELFNMMEDFLDEQQS